MRLILSGKLEEDHLWIERKGELIILGTHTRDLRSEGRLAGGLWKDRTYLAVNQYVLSTCLDTLLSKVPDAQ